MIIEVLHIDDCPSWVEAGNRLREALDTTGFGDAKINYRVLKTTDEVAGVPFAGSPTIGDALVECSCCGRSLSRRKVHALSRQAGFLCRRCGLWIALRPRSDASDY